MRVLICDPILNEGIEILKREFHVDTNIGLSENDLVNIIKDYDALIVRSGTNVTEKVIENAYNLKVIGRAGVGVDNIDIKAATLKGILVVNAPEGNTIAAVEHTIAMMLSMSRKIPQASASLKNGLWNKKAFMGVEVKGKTLGVIGLGRIGREVAKRAKALHMNVVAYDPYISQDIRKDGIEMVNMETLVSTSDYITLHAPLTPNTKHILGEKEFEIVKEGVRIINCARGGLIDEKALYNAIIKGRVAGASLDVFEEEPAINNELLKLDQVIATPHLGASTEEAQVNVSIDIAKDVIRALKNQTVKNAVNMMTIKPEEWDEMHPYVMLAEKLGRFYSQFKNGRVREMEIGISGNITKYKTSILIAAALKGLLNEILQEPVNLVNALEVAKQREIKIIKTTKIDNIGDYSNLITLKIISDADECIIGGTVFGENDQRIVMIDGYKIDLLPEGNIIFISHKDKPGMIGSVGTILGKNDINIATMQVGRMSPRGGAIMALTVDEYVDPRILKEIADTEDIEEIKFLEF
ncbi:MAG TPA: phosphoglycerate dehydrogenase [Thermoanaerobacterales bacterium]|nr:phosphoglycerate dehydrogenase [Thermoanaerobacterales bacterium]